jgi:hypothetical protein
MWRQAEGVDEFCNPVEGWLHSKGNFAILTKSRSKRSNYLVVKRIVRRGGHWQEDALILKTRHLAILSTHGSANGATPKVKDIILTK